MNLQTGFKEAKLLVEEENPGENETTALLEVESENDDEINRQDINTDVDLEAARSRLKEALKNIPSEKFDDVTEEKWKEITKKFKSYKELKEDLKELELNMQTDGELLKELIEKYLNIKTNDKASLADKLTILEDLEYLSHSLDNSLLFISLGGLESIIIPNLNLSNIELLSKTLSTIGVIVQNNAEAQSYVMEKTNIPNYLINIMSKSINSNQLSATLFAFGSLIRNNKKISSELFKKGTAVLIEVIEKSEFSLSLKTKALGLLDDLLNIDYIKDQAYIKFVDTSRMCNLLDDYFTLNRNNFIADINLAEKAIESLAGLRVQCNHTWSQSPAFRHTLLVLLNSSKAQLESDEDLRFVYSENVLLLEKLNKFLYGELKISQDDLSQKYDHRINEEL